MEVSWHQIPLTIIVEQMENNNVMATLFIFFQTHQSSYLLTCKSASKARKVEKSRANNVVDLVWLSMIILAFWLDFFT